MRVNVNTCARDPGVVFITTSDVSISLTIMVCRVADQQQVIYPGTNNKGVEGCKV